MPLIVQLIVRYSLLDVRPESGLKVIGRRKDKKLWLGNVKGFTVAFTDKQVEELEQEL
jgi:hypothetical protein